MEEKETTVSGLWPQTQPTRSVNTDRNIDLGGTAASATVATPQGNSGSVDLLGKKKRGRPRKYDSDGNLKLPSFNSVVSSSSSPPAFSLTPSPEFTSSSKRGRGRPPGSGNWQLLASLGELFANTAGGDFTPHVVTVNTGEDVAGKILSFSQKGPRGICVLSANGAVSNVTIRQPGSSGGILTYEGRFEIVSLSGSFTVFDTGGVRSRTGGLSVSLAGPDGRVIGGGVAGLLLAASPIQIVVGSFLPNGYKMHKRKHHQEQMTTSRAPAAAEAVTVARPISQASPDGETRLTSLSPLLEVVDSTTNDKEVQNTTSSLCAVWNSSKTTTSHGQSPDINVSLPSE